MKQITFETPVEIEATRANLTGDPLESVSYECARLKKQLPVRFLFLFGRWYEFTYESGAKVRVKRNNTRLYSGKLEEGFTGIEFAPKGPKSKVVHRVVSIEELPEDYVHEG